MAWVVISLIPKNRVHDPKKGEMTSNKTVFYRVQDSQGRLRCRDALGVEEAGFDEFRPQGPRDGAALATPAPCPAGRPGTLLLDGPDISFRRAMRLAMLGWVENKLSTPLPDSGLAMYMWAMAGLRSASMFGMA